MSYQFGISKEFPCSYLPDRQERLLIAVEEQLNCIEGYSWLMSQGFRRSGEQIYRPHCINCQACQSIRVVVTDFISSKSQRRLLKKKSAFHCKNIPSAARQLLFFISKIH